MWDTGGDAKGHCTFFNTSVILPLGNRKKIMRDNKSKRLRFDAGQLCLYGSKLLTHILKTHSRLQSEMSQKLETQYDQYSACWSMVPKD